MSISISQAKSRHTLKLEHWGELTKGTIIRAGARRPTSGGEAPWTNHSTEQWLWPAPGLTGQGEEGRAYQKPEKIVVAGEQAKRKTRQCLPHLLSFLSITDASHWERQLGDAVHNGQPCRAQYRWEESEAGRGNGKYPAPHPNGEVKNIFFLVMQVWELGERLKSEIQIWEPFS